MKKNRSVIAGLLAGLLLAGCLAALPAAAEEPGTDTAAQVVAASSSPTTTPAPTTAPTPAPTATPTAATAAPSATAAPTDTPATGDVYVIAYTVTDAAGGEVATVKWNDTVNIVLKVLDHSSARYSVSADDIATRINSSVFQYSGTGEISQLVEGSDQNGAYYSYVLLFRDVKYVGGGNSLPILLSYLDSTLPIQNFNVSIGQCVDKDPDDTSKVKSPNLVLRETSYGSEAVTAGKPFTLSMTVYATGGGEALNDVVVSVTLPEHITLTGGSLSTYIGTIGAKDTRQVSFPILPAAGMTASVANITVNMTGTGAKTGNAVNSSSTISVPVIQPDRFELGNLTIPDSMAVGESGSVTLSMVNKGKNPLSNVEASISGTNLGNNSSMTYIGNLNAGSENSVDFDLAPTEAGTLSGTITIDYEDSNGALQTVSKNFSCSVTEPMPMDDGMGMPQETPQAGMPVWGWILIVAAGAVVIVLVVLFIRKKRKAAAINKLEDSDEAL